MISVHGIYDGRSIRVLEKIKARPNAKVIITFLDDEPLTAETDGDTEKFLALSGTWEDERSPEEIVRDIYESRTTGKSDVFL